jgi:hypothetical protein
MTHDGTAYRATTYADAGEVEVREEVDDAGDMFEVRLPVASTGEVRNVDDDPLTRDELDGMARQINEGDVGVFPQHGNSRLIDGDRYSQFERLGNWRAADIETRAAEDGADLLTATARMPDPDTLPRGTREFRQMLTILKVQADRGIGIGASIGWSDDEDAPGGVDLMEVSVVGIGADPRTSTQSEDAGIVARAAVDAGVDPETLVETVRDYVEDARPLGPPEDPDRFDSFEECVTSIMDDDTSREEAEAICGSFKEATESEQDAGDRNLDDPEFAEDDPVRWSSQDTPVHGRVAGIHEQYSPAEGVTITGEEGEAVYSIYEYDDSLETPAFRDSPSNPNVAKPQSSLSESGLDMPPATAENFASEQDATPETQDDAMTDDTTTDDPDEQTHDETADTTRMNVAELTDMAEDILMGHMEAAMDDLETELEAAMGENGDEESEGDTAAMDGEDAEDDDDMEDDEEERDTEVANLRAELDALRDELAETRQGGVTADDVQTADADTTADEQDDDTTDDRATAGPNWRND